MHTINSRSSWFMYANCMQIEKGLKTKCLETPIIIAPPIGESYNFDELKNLLIIFKSEM